LQNYGRLDKKIKSQHKNFHPFPNIKSYKKLNIIKPISITHNYHVITLAIQLAPNQQDNLQNSHKPLSSQHYHSSSTFASLTPTNFYQPFHSLSFLFIFRSICCRMFLEPSSVLFSLIIFWISFVSLLFACLDDPLLVFLCVFFAYPLPVILTFMVPIFFRLCGPNSTLAASNSSIECLKIILEAVSLGSLFLYQPNYQTKVFSLVFPCLHTVNPLMLTFVVEELAEALLL
jgi:hypothetical protein